MSDIVERIDAMIEGHAARHGIAINDVVELLSDAKDVLLGLPPEAYKATGGGDNSLSSSISLQSELNKLRAELADLQQTNAEQATIIVDYAQQLAEARKAPRRLLGVMADQIKARALKSPKPPIL